MALHAPTNEKEPERVRDRLLHALEENLLKVPESSEVARARPEEHARELTRRAANRAAVISGGMALPVGPLGLLTIVPDLIAIWRVQAQMVADIAAVYGRTDELSREHMLYFLFRHSAGQAVRDLVARIGERVIIQGLSARALRTVLGKIEVRLSERLLGRFVSRWVPLVGAMAIGGYTWYDTTQVAGTAIDFYEYDRRNPKGVLTLEVERSPIEE